MGGRIYLIHRGWAKDAAGVLKPIKGLSFRRKREDAEAIVKLLNETLIKLQMLEHFTTHFNNTNEGRGAEQLLGALGSKAAQDGFMRTVSENPSLYTAYMVTEHETSKEEEEEMRKALDD
jgi:hypothetical protein